MLGRLALFLRRAWLLIVGGDDRCIFRFYDGQRMRAVDPLVTYRLLDGHAEFNWLSDPKLIERPSDGDPLLDRAKDEAMQKCVAAVREAFGLPVFDGRRGLTETECYALLLEFTMYVGAVKKKHDTLPISPEPTGSESSEPSTTLPDSDCGCGSAASTAVEPPK